MLILGIGGWIHDGAAALMRDGRLVAAVEEEKLAFDLQSSFTSRLHARLVNLYGPTEACIDTTHRECNGDLDLAQVPIGREVHPSRPLFMTSSRTLSQMELFSSR